MKNYQAMTRICVFTIFLSLFINVDISYGRILPTGMGKTYPTITAAAAVAVGGDTILCYDATLAGGMYIENLKGSAQAWICILAAQPGQTAIVGGGNSIQFSDARYVCIDGFVISGQTGNGMNLDDGGSYESPSSHVRLKNCVFENINASGNNDLLKLSGIDSFWVSHCVFRNGAAGGSGIDMVGCHFGTIEDCSFSQLGSNSIQAKGGTADLLITRNIFTNGGVRALNLGGSTGLSFFRPIDAKYEAARIRVIANVISGSEAPIAYVGCTQVEVSNNTLLLPTKWVARILQETVDPTRFVPCGNNRFFNNIIVVDQRVNVVVNIGPNTAPETFAFEHNFWYKTSEADWSGPQLPGTKLNNWIGDPLLVQDSLYVLQPTSPAIGKGLSYQGASVKDIVGKPFRPVPSLGAWEIKTVISNTENPSPNTKVLIYPNPAGSEIMVNMNATTGECICIYDMEGHVVEKATEKRDDGRVYVEVSRLSNGVYFIFDCNHRQYLGSFVKQ